MGRCKILLMSKQPSIKFNTHSLISEHFFAGYGTDRASAPYEPSHERLRRPEHPEAAEEEGAQGSQNAALAARAASAEGVGSGAEEL